ncbi:MAG: magnetochrome domain-containing protein [Magnetococcales bacterium]|nr:magnetochrome domain-containing protein [Magnetococcales bacterium]
MNIAEWIMAVGIVFGIGLLLLSVVKNDPWEDHVYDNVPPIAAGVPSPHRAGRQKMVCSSCHEIISPTLSGRSKVVPYITRNAVSPHGDARDKQLCTNCHKITARSTPKKVVQTRVQAKSIAVAQRIPLIPRPDPTMGKEAHERFSITRFQGRIIRVVTKTVVSGRENLNVLIDNGFSKAAWYNLAPFWFLHKIDCGVQQGLFVKGTAYKEIGQINPQMQYVKTISVNGHLCELRNRHMTGLWEPGAALLHKEE